MKEEDRSYLDPVKYQLLVAYQQAVHAQQFATPKTILAAVLGLPCGTATTNRVAAMVTAAVQTKHLLQECRHMILCPLSQRIILWQV
jgi:hypothetical protein